ncbi:proteasome activator [Nonomuraea maritima]|uniref:proteasome activator n=1 Tax=Nonomuraea maritima TaxID=683260 RepID=UPI0037206307
MEEIGHAVGPELREELERLLPRTGGPFTEAEARILQSRLVGWLEGVFQGIKAELSLRQMTPANPPTRPRR